MRNSVIVAWISVLVVIGMHAEAETNRVLTLNGSTAYVQVPSQSDLSLSQTDFSLVAWVKLDAYNTLNSAIMYRRKEGSTNGWTFGVAGTLQDVEAKKVSFLLSQWKDGRLVATNELSLGIWHNVAFTFNNTTSNAYLYIDGQLNAQTNFVCPRAVTNDLYIGQDTLGNPYYWRGAMDDVQIWTKALSQTEIQSNMATRLTGSEPNLIAYWNFDNGTANDLTINAHNGIFRGGATVSTVTSDISNVYPAMEVTLLSGTPLNFYQLQYTESLSVTNWINVGEPVRGNGKTLSLFDGPHGAPKRFYRVFTNY